MSGAVDTRSARPVFAQARTSQRWSVADANANQQLANLFDAQLPVDPMYPTAQRVRSTYITPIDAPEWDDRTAFYRVREYLGRMDGATADAPPAAFLEVKFIEPNGLKRKERIAATADVLDRLATGDAAPALAPHARTDADRALADHVATAFAPGGEVEPFTDYGRRAWESADGTLRVTLDDVGPEGAVLDAHNAVKRILEVKTVGSTPPPMWLEDALHAGTASGSLESLARAATPTATDDALRAVAHIVTTAR